MIEIMLPPPKDSILSYLYHSAPDNAVYDIIFCILAVTILLLIDILLREIVSIIEKLNELDAEAFKWFKELRQFIKDTKEVIKS